MTTTLKKGRGIFLSRSWIILFSFIAMLFLFTACSGNKEESKSEESAQTSGQDSDSLEVPEPDLSGIPDVVAKINDKEITKEEFELTYEQQFQQAVMQSQLTGQEVNQDELKEQIVEMMVGQQLLIQEADKRISEAPEEDVNKTLDILLEQAQVDDEEKLFAMFEDQGMDKDVVMKEIEQQVKVEHLITNESGDIEPTEEELKESYESLKMQHAQMDSEEEPPAFDDVKEALKDQLKGQKEIETAETLIEKLREDAEIKVYL